MNKYIGGILMVMASSAYGAELAATKIMRFASHNGNIVTYYQNQEAGKRLLASYHTLDQIYQSWQEVHRGRLGNWITNQKKGEEAQHIFNELAKEYDKINGPVSPVADTTSDSQ